MIKQFQKRDHILFNEARDEPVMKL